MGSKRWVWGVLSSLILVVSVAAMAEDASDRCTEALTTTVAKPEAVVKAPVTEPKWTLSSFLSKDPQTNLAVQHPFTIANAAEKAYAMIMNVPSRKAVDPLYHIKPVTIYPMLAGEDPAAGGRMVVGQESSLDAFVGFIGSVANGDRSGKTLGFPGPAGTGKTELLYVLSNIEKNLGKQPKYMQFSYRFKNLDEVPFLRYLFKRDPSGKPITDFVDPDMARSPFTLLRSDMQDEVMTSAPKQIQSKWGITISNGWRLPEPKSAVILKAIFEHEMPEIAHGQMTVEDIPAEKYLEILNKYVVIVPKTLLVPRQVANVIRAQTDNPNYQALFASPNIARAAYYGMDNALGVDYKGLIFRQDGGLLMFDELFRNQGEFLNILLEVIQNHVAQTDFGDPVQLDIVPIWNSNDESIEKAREDSAIKALLDRTERRPMRSLLPPNQIESVALFQVGLDRFKQRKLNETEITPLKHEDVYPAPDAQGHTYGSHGRYALYYVKDGQDILIAPYALDYMCWLASATRTVVDVNRLQKFKDELNLVTARPALFTNPIDRVRIMIGDKQAERAELMDLARLKDLAEEGATGISARDIESWFKDALKIAMEKNKGVLTPAIIDQAFQKDLDEGVIKPGKDSLRAEWQNIRKRAKLELLLPKLEQDIKAIISGDGQRAERIYDEVERELIAKSEDQNATKVVPEDGSQEILINETRLNEIRQIYRQKFGRDFNPMFLLRNLPGARKGVKPIRDPELLEAIRINLSRHEAATADYISTFESYYRGDNVDPSVRQKVSEVEPILASYGYDRESFKEAVAFLAQLQRTAEMERMRKNGPPQ